LFHEGAQNFCPIYFPVIPPLDGFADPSGRGFCWDDIE
jgi:hypothetical protein